jgi:hypothetical protein
MVRKLQYIVDKLPRPSCTGLVLPAITVAHFWDMAVTCTRWPTPGPHDQSTPGIAVLVELTKVHSENSFSCTIIGLVNGIWMER